VLVHHRPVISRLFWFELDIRYKHNYTSLPPSAETLLTSDVYEPLDSPSSRPALASTEVGTNETSKEESRKGTGTTLLTVYAPTFVSHSLIKYMPPVRIIVASKAPMVAEFTLCTRGFKVITL
jgi:hypothetical protein